MAKKLKKKQRKPMSLKTRNIIVNGFKSILSNQAAIDGGKEGPWWLAIVFFVISVFLPLIPIYTNLNKVYGSQFLSGANFGFDRGLALATEFLKENNYELKVEDDHLLHFYHKVGDDLVEFDESMYNNTIDSAIFSDTYKDDNGHEVYTFRLYISSLKDTDNDKALTNFINKLDKDAVYIKNTTTLATNDKEKTGGYVSNFMVLQKETMTAALYKYGTTTRTANASGGNNWAHTTGDILTLATKDVSGDLDVIANPPQQSKIFSNWKSIFNDAYLDQKNATKWNTTLIYMGVYGGLILFLGLMLFLLTRGKNNIFNYLNFWVCQKIAYWLSPTPAILGMILGFIMSGSAIGQMAFIMLVSLRVMWASMRQLRPIQ